jgi:tRNA threonylcarbamoyladenosine biosynthesis protein TsaB
MKLLMIDTATNVASAAALTEEKLLVEIIINNQKKHSERLMPAVDHMLADAGLAIDQMDAFGIIKGPGSFTGLRIGMATVKGLAQALDKPVVPVSTLEALAMNLPYADGLICPILDARRHQVYTGVYAFEDGRLVNCLPDGAMAVDELAAWLADRQAGPVTFLGDGVPAYFETLAQQVSGARRVFPNASLNRASSGGALALQRALSGEVMDCRDVEPFYIRKSYADEAKKS